MRGMDAGISEKVAATPLRGRLRLSRAPGGLKCVTTPDIILPEGIVEWFN